ncbi:hypothetical protein [Mycolicibacterium sediminis]|uniref:Uncharacterized protein n=1 Tax=Mycolicibacterium sediminis TaxID=1286180 RepID=A0A7I7QR39_9MYCO|nr:hypothetical protein [Mycolicibacterium sediminis]BBY28407.1 hypothetical protein MSEDJ_25030 [Mycolicibacterium sediminis]
MDIEADDLAQSAFGARPDRWPLPPAATPAELWHRAVAAGGQGRYASAFADLETLVRVAAGGPFASLAHSTHASFLRQLGDHDAARPWDGRAWALADGHPEAAADALVGLAADALGTGRFELSADLLHRAAQITADAAPRIPVRLAWVSAELAMFTGDGTAAVRHARRAVDLAGAIGSARHAVKSEVVLAAALCSRGDVEACRQVADAALDAAQALALIPLTWALACLLADVGSAALTPSAVTALRDRSAATVRVGGGVWSVR